MWCVIVLHDSTDCSTASRECECVNGCVMYCVKCVNVMYIVLYKAVACV